MDPINNIQLPKKSSKIKKANTNIINLVDGIGGETSR